MRIEPTTLLLVQPLSSNPPEIDLTADSERMTDLVPQGDWQVLVLMR
jgi:hypothetical protein